MVFAILTWALAGVAMGGLANAARWGIGAQRRDLPQPWLLTLVLGACAGLLGGLAGQWLFSDLVAFPAALSASGLVIVLVAWALRHAPSTAKGEEEGND